MIKVRGLDHIVIRARDAQLLIGFYRDVLGCPVERETSAELGLVQLRAGDSLIDIVSVEGRIGRQGGAAPGTGGRNMDHFCLRVEPFDVPAIRAHLARHGMVGGEVETRYGAEGNGPSIYIEDPEGNSVELKGPPDRD